MRFNRFAGALAASVLLALPAVFAAAQGDATATVQTAYDAQCAAILHADWNALSNTLAPGFTLSAGGTTYTRAQVIAAAQGTANRITLTKCATTVDSATSQNGTIVAVTRQTVDGTHGTDAFEIATGWRDLWSEQGSDVLESSSTQLWQTVTVNGNVVQQTGTAPTPQPRR